MPTAWKAEEHGTKLHKKSQTTAKYFDFLWFIHIFLLNFCAFGPSKRKNRHKIFIWIATRGVLLAQISIRRIHPERTLSELDLWQCPFI